MHSATDNTWMPARWRGCTRRLRSRGKRKPMNDGIAVAGEPSGVLTRQKDMPRVGFVGSRGMVGSVLMQRMLQENDFALIEPEFFTASNVGGAGPAIGK